MYIYIYICISSSASCRCAIIVVPWCLRRLSLFSICINMLFDKHITQAKHDETDPRHGTSTMAHFQPPDKSFT